MTDELTPLLFLDFVPDPTTAQLEQMAAELWCAYFEQTHAVWDSLTPATKRAYLDEWMTVASAGWPVAYAAGWADRGATDDEEQKHLAWEREDSR